MGEMWMKTLVMCACEWKTSDCEKVSTLHASGPLETMKRIWKLPASRFEHTLVSRLQQQKGVRARILKYSHECGGRHDPQVEQCQRVCKVAKVEKQKVLALGTECLPPQGGQRDRLERVPEVKQLRSCANNVCGKRDIQHAEGEAGLIMQLDVLCQG